MDERPRYCAPRRAGAPAEAILSARGPRGHDFDIALTGEWEINPTLLHLLKTDHRVHLSSDDLLAEFDDDAQPPDPAALFEHFEKSGRRSPGS